MTHTTILGLNAWHGDASACLVVDGELVAAAEEERFRRVKHWAGFPAQAVRWCLEQGGVAPEALDWLAINRDPTANRLRKAAFALVHQPSLAHVRDRRRNARKLNGVEAAFADACGLDPARMRARVARVEHHLAHLASSYLVSPFERAAAVSVDGFGDFSSLAWGVGNGARLDVRARTRFPHSLGLFYLAGTQLLGFPYYGDEYKVMGLAGYGEPTFLPRLREILRLTPEGGFELDLDCFVHHKGGAAMSWDNRAPRVGRVFSSAFERALLPAREPGRPLGPAHHDLAASIQARYEEALVHVLRHVAQRTGERDLCLSGGCAMNSLANGRVLEATPFERLYVPPAPGDAGGAVGAALDVWCNRLGNPRPAAMRSADLGPGFDDETVRRLLEERRDALAGCTIVHALDDEELCARTAARLADGDVVGWFQGRMEWGPRALGQRSILADPRRTDMRRLLNAKIKLREGFRPFAPSVLRESVRDWFHHDDDVPFMLEVRPVRAERRDDIPAVTHVDGTGRLQTVDRERSPLFHGLISAFRDRTGVPLLLNTSFNENEPVVCRPEEALDCFLRTGMDGLVMGRWIVERPRRAALAA